ncbi:RNA polymerase III-inhibiting protein maf1 [Rhizoclosmatium sp. JEL0117]|nr:RNA polymerase III-inhibiting protein maf1 [Rhizoclosmatium hyalinum]KAJ3298881.1 RNA polymerase III-inhibiting protein maf1 [Rhizoclosmatium sp. JEL0117]KAJ3298890.1 RNA polymerase III-inhibiting protein maf1 [Rhizoclosmatium sp. JEL0117]
MKYLEYNSLEEINTALSTLETLDTRVFSRLDAYSCKSTTDEKKLKMYIEEKYEGDADVLLGASPGTAGFPYGSSFTAPTPTAGSFSFSNGPISHSPTSPFGPLAQISSRKTLFYLLATLNAAFPDYDFSDVKPELFVKIPLLNIVQRNVTATLFRTAIEGVQTNNLSLRLWEAIDEVIQLQECDVYSFNPNPEEEPDSEEGNLWSFYYFFFNRKLKRVVFFTARAVSYMAPAQPEELTNDIYGDVGDEPMFGDSDMGLSYEQYTMESMEV